MKIFGYELKLSKQEKDRENLPKIPLLPDGIESSILIDNMYRTSYETIRQSVITELQLINRYRMMSIHHHVDNAIDDICTEILAKEDEQYSSVRVDFSDEEIEIPSKIKDKIIEEFQYIFHLLKFRSNGDEIIRKWYVDGRLYYICLVDPKKEKEGIKEIRYVDPRRIRKITEVKREIDSSLGIEVISGVDEYFVYDYRGLAEQKQSEYRSLPYYDFYQLANNQMFSTFRLSKDSVVFVHSGIIDSSGHMVYSYLQKAIKPLNQLKVVEDYTVIYRTSRGADRKLFKIPVGNMAPERQKTYMQSIIDAFRSNIQYDDSTGELYTESNLYSVQRDYFIPVQDSQTSATIEDVNGASNLSEMDKGLEYFKENLYKALNVPIGRLDSSKLHNIGRVNEIERDEVKYSSFISKLRIKFSELFLELLSRQLVLKGICSPDDWEIYSRAILFIFDKNNYYAELKEAEMLKERALVADGLEKYEGKYFSREWIRRNIFKQDEDLIKDMDKQIADEHDQYLEKTRQKTEIELRQAENEIELAKALDLGVDPTNSIDSFTKNTSIDLDGDDLIESILINSNEKYK
jgi:hypothetical protein